MPGHPEQLHSLSLFEGITWGKIRVNEGGRVGRAVAPGLRQKQKRGEVAMASLLST